MVSIIFLLAVTKVQIVSNNLVTSLIIPVLTVSFSFVALFISLVNLYISSKERKSQEKLKKFNFDLVVKNTLFDLVDERFYVFLTFVNFSSEPTAILDLKLSTGRTAESPIPDDSIGIIGGTFTNEEKNVFKTTKVNATNLTHEKTSYISKGLPIVIPANSVVGGYFSFASGKFSSHILFERKHFDIEVVTTAKTLDYEVNLNVYPESEQTRLINK